MNLLPYVQNVPEVVGWKVLAIVQESTQSEDTELEVTLQLNRRAVFISGAALLLPRNSRAWYYTGGTSWLFYCDGDIFIEPITLTSGKDPAQGMQPGEVWVITLDDASEQLHISQCFSSSRGEKE